MRRKFTFPVEPLVAMITAFRADTHPGALVGTVNLAGPVALAPRSRSEWLAMGGQIVDAILIESRRPRLTKAEKDILKGGGASSEWKPARRAEIDRDGRWTIRRGRQRETPTDGHECQPEVAAPMFGHKDHVGIDREHGFLRRFFVTHAAAYDGGQLDLVLDRDNTVSGVWADTAYRSAANLALLDRRGLKSQFQRKKPRGRRMPAHIARGNATPRPGALPR
jgi:IS5 family transposase